MSDTPRRFPPPPPPDYGHRNGTYGLPPAGKRLHDAARQWALHPM
jgi:hypothetical protein